MVKNNFPNCLSRSILTTEEILDPGVRHGWIVGSDRTKDAAVLRVALGKGSPSVCGCRSGQARAWRGRVYRAGLGVRSANHSSGSPRSGRGRGCGGGAHPQKGGGRPPRAVAQPTLEANLRHLLQEFTAGDPMRAGVLWTNLSLRELSRRLLALGTPASRRTIRRLLRKLQVGRRTARKKKTMGHHPDRNAQFDNIARLRREYEATGDAVISIDTKKKELLGNFHRTGTTFTAETVETFDHDFGSASQGKLIPHGIYDMLHQHAHIHLNTSHDTSKLCCDSVALWWEQAGRVAHPQATRLLVLGDGGGSNSASQYLFKQDLQGLANRLGLEIRVAHYPPYCSKYNLIEHRLFPHVTRACRGVIFHTLETVRYYMAKTETTTGLEVKVSILDTVYQTGRTYAADFKHNMKIVFDDYLP